MRRLVRFIWEPVTRHLDTRFTTIDSRLDVLERSLDLPARLAPTLAALRDDIWHSKALPMGDRILVGCRHLSLSYLIEADDRLIGPRFIVDGEYEPETTAFIMNAVSPDSVCIDVGANFGYYTCLMARLGWKGRTLSFEPDPQMFGLLCENIAINWAEQIVEPHNAATTSEAQPVQLYRRHGRSGNTGIIRPDDAAQGSAGGDAVEFTADGVTLDSFADSLDRVDLIKIDVEGGETLVLAGMEKLVRTHRPVIIMEWSPEQTEQAGFSVRELVHRLERLDLAPNVLAPSGETSAVTFDELAELPYQNVVFRPRPA